jgi:RND superfamily putative drug exporter
MDRITGTLAGLGASTVTVTAATLLSELPRLEKAVVLAAAALAERAPVVLLDVADPLPEDEARALLVALDRLAPATTTVVLGTPGASALAFGAPARVTLAALAPSTKETVHV